MGFLHDLFLQTNEGFVAFSVNSRHIYVEYPHQRIRPVLWPRSLSRGSPRHLCRYADTIHIPIDENIFVNAACL